MKKILTEYDFIQAVNLLAIGYNCECYMIDCQTKTIKIRGPEDQQVACAIAMSDFMDRHDVEELVYITPLNYEVSWIL